MACLKESSMINNWKKNSVYISFTQVSLLIVNLLLITIISREYGPSIYGEYASSKSLAVLIGTALVLSLALVVTKLRARNESISDFVFANSYFLIIRNLSNCLYIPLSFDCNFQKRFYFDFIIFNRFCN